MISKEREGEIVRLFHVEKWLIGTIASELGHHHATVQRVLAESGVAKTLLYQRPTLIDPFLPFIVATLEKHPRLRATRLYVMVKERGYEGSRGHFRALLRRYRPRKQPEAYLRVRTLAGEQAQVDWGHFGKVQIGKATRTLSAFVMVLSWSRQIFLRFYWDQRMPSFLRGHVDAFEFFGGVPRTLLYDNLKSAVLEREGDVIRFHPTLVEISRHYRYLPKPSPLTSLDPSVLPTPGPPARSRSCARGTKRRRGEALGSAPFGRRSVCGQKGEGSYREAGVILGAGSARVGRSGSSQSSASRWAVRQ